MPNTDKPDPRYDNAGAVDDALAAVKTRFDHGEAQYDPDILALIRAAEAMRATLYGSSPAGQDPMPVFVIKGKDMLATATVNAYRSLCELRGLSDQAAQAALARDEIADWQTRNPILVQVPDHRHVPAL